MDAPDSRETPDPVDARARLAGSNPMGILLFSLGTAEIFGIDVLKVREVMLAPPVTRAPNMPFGVEGVMSLRGNIISVIALARFVGAPAAGAACEAMIIAEFGRHQLAFLVNTVDRILRVDWQAVKTVDAALAGRDELVSAVTALADGALVSILDLERVVSRVLGETAVPAERPAQAALPELAPALRPLLAA